MSDEADEPAEDETAADPGETAGHADDPALPVFNRYLDARRRSDDEAAAQAWEELTVMTYPLMRSKIARRAGRPGLAWLAEGDIDDIAQDAYLRAQGMAHTFNGEALGQARAALLTTAHNTALDANRRREARERDVDGSFDERREHEDGSSSARWEGHAGEEDWTERSALASLEHEEIVEAIGQIPSEDQRQVLALTFWQGQTSGEIAETMGKSVNNVDKLRERGYRALKGVLGHE